MQVVLPIICRLSHIFVLSYGWRRLVLALSSGALASLSLAPLNATIALVFAFSFLVWLLDGAVGIRGNLKNPLACFLICWGFGFGYHFIGLYWVGHAFLIESEKYGWLLPFAVVLLPAILACFMGIAGIALNFCWLSGWRRIICLALCISLSDGLRGGAPFDFPWNGFGNAIVSVPILDQTLAIFGVRGSGFLVVLFAAAPALLAERKIPKIFFVAITAIFTAALIHGSWRLSSHELEFEEEVALRLVQPSIAQTEKWKEGSRQKILDKMIDLSTRPWPEALRDAHHRLIIWPEMALPTVLTENGEELARIADFLDDRTQLLTGALRAENSSEQTVYYNSIYLINGDGAIVSAYDKVKLVPFGEYMPLGDWFSDIDFSGLASLSSKFVAGYGRQAIQANGVPPLLPLICFEVIFSDLFDKRELESKWILNLTNDAWFGRSSGPFQHLQHARARSIEQGLPLIRVANTGISVATDNLGKIYASVNLYASTNIDLKLPKAGYATVYSLYGLQLEVMILMVSIGILLVSRWLNIAYND